LRNQPKKQRNATRNTVAQPAEKATQRNNCFLALQTIPAII
jgi:hypothetical protein